MIFASYGPGCLAAIGAVAVAFLFGHRGAAIVALLVVGPAVALGLVPFIGSIVVRVLHKKRRESLRRGPCPSCGSMRRTAIHSVGTKKMPCPRCRSHAVTVTFAGMS